MIKKALCVDDDPITLMIIKKMIKRASLVEELITASNGQQAINLIDKLSKNKESVPPQLIFLDLNMPIMNGWDFMEEFEAKYLSMFPYTKVAILTSSVDPADSAKAALYKSVIGFYSKPLSKQMLENIKSKINPSPMP